MGFYPRDVGAMQAGRTELVLTAPSGGLWGGQTVEDRAELDRGTDLEVPGGVPRLCQ